MLRLTERPFGGVMILDLHGTISPGPEEVNLDDRVRSILHRGYRKLVLNLADFTSSDASGVSALLGTLLAARASHAEVKLLHVTRRMTDVLIVVALYRYFAVCDSEREALESFQEAEAVQVA